MVGRSASAFLSVACFALVGCQSLESGPSREISPLLDGEEAKLFPADPSRQILRDFTWNSSDNAETKVEKRNEYVTSRMYFVDRAFHDYEQTFLRDVRSSGFLMDFVISALAIGAASIRDDEIVRAFTTAGATAVAGRTTAEKQILMDRTLPTLLNQMRASRADQKAKILERLRMTYAQYPIGLAQSDVDAYYQAGTLIGALTAAADAATVRKISEEAQADRVLRGVYQSNSYTEALRAYLDADDDAEADRRYAIFEQQLAAVYVSQTPEEFTDMNEDLRLKKQILDALIEAETDAQVKQQLIDARDKAKEEEQGG